MSNQRTISTLTPEEERQMDLISNAIIDLILANPGKFTKRHLPNKEKGDNLVVKDDMK